VSAAARRRARLLDAIPQLPDEIRTGQVMALYRAHGWGPSRTTARRDLRYLAQRGQLTEHGADNDRWYSHNTRKDVRP
jgi:Fe2+ or Zn2+ uptake regulation protein